MVVAFNAKSYLEQGFDIVKANLLASVVVGLVCAVPVIGWFLGPIVLVNFMAGVKAAKHEGKSIEIGALFNFENVTDKLIAPVGVGVALCLFLVPGALILFAPCLIADRPGTPFMNAIKGALAFGKANLVPSCMLTLALGAVIVVSALLCLVPLLLGLPTAYAAAYLAYEDHKAAFEAAAAEGGVQL